MGKNKHRFHQPTPSGQRWRWVLPQDLREIKLAAFVQGMISATSQLQQGQELAAYAIEAGALSAALLWEEQVHGGRKGCNDPIAFRKHFSDMCARIWQATYAYWLEAPEVYSSFSRRPPEQQVSHAQFMAEKYLPLVEQLIQEGKPVRFDW